MSNEDSTLNFNEQIIAEFRANEGRAAAFGDAPLLLLTTKGSKTGKEHTTPVMYLADEHDSTLVYVFASYAGADTHPAWYNNLLTNPYDVIVEVGVETNPATPEVVDEPERIRIYAEQSRRFPGFSEYQAKTSRTIPVVALRLHD
jgi:deazaflavin-dependent oxidoreductase (nitroreductase family)